MNNLIGIDLGTSGVKTVLFDMAGGVVVTAAVEYPLYQPANGWAEQKPSDWWNGVVSTLRSVLDTSDISAGDIAGIGISGQMHGLVMLDENGEVLRNSILWCDGRTTEECAEITERVGAQRLIEITANPALTGFTASKILWVRKHEPALFEKCRHILLPKDYIRYKLTGEFATEVSDASGMCLLDVANRCWSDEVLQALEIDRSLLGKVYESCEVTGTVHAQAAEETGLVAGTPVVGGAGDNAAAAIGTGVVTEGKAFTTIGTSGVIFAHSDRVMIDPAGRVHTFCAAVPGAWTVMSCTLAAGLSLRWLRNQFFAGEIQAADGMKIDPYLLLDRQAEQVPLGSNRLLFLPYLMGERSPLLDEKSRGVFFGLSAIHTKYDMLRAVMEGVSFSQRQCLDVLREMGVPFKEMVACGGGGRSTLWRQMLADIYDCPVRPVASKEAAALGGAILAGVGAKFYPDVKTACANMVHTNPSQMPNGDMTARYEHYYKIYKSLYPALKDSFHQLAAL